MNSPRYGLKSYIQRTLALRLLIGGGIIALVFSLMTYLARYDDIGEAAIIHATNAIERLRVEVRSQLDSTNLTLAEILQAALDREPEYRLVSRYGEFVYARFYTAQGETLAARALADAPLTPALETYLQQQPVQFPTLGEPLHQASRIDGRDFIHVIIPIADRAGEPAAYVEGLYALSEETLAQTRADALRTAAYVVLIVAATSLLLFPVVTLLTGRVANFSERLLNANLETIQVLGDAIAKRDSDTDAHNYRVTIYAIRLAEAARLDTESIRGLIKGAFLHDVGKIGIRDEILHKPARLDDAEFTIMKTHVDHGLAIINRSSWLDDAADIVGAHHEKFDGSGYPEQLRAQDIPRGARIFAITDVFDALTSRRPYKEPFSFDETMDILEQGRGTHFDPELLDLFAGLAQALYEKYSGREDDGLHQELAQLVQQYFSLEPETLVR